MSATHQHERPCEGYGCGGLEFEQLEDEYGSLAQGGSYERCRCVKCGKISYSELPD